MDAERMSAEDFFSQIENASSWAIRKERLTGDYHVMARTPQGIRSCRSPKINEMSEEEVTQFITALEAITSRPDVAARRAGLQERDWTQ